MPLAEFQLFLGESAADEKQLDKFSKIVVDQAIGMAGEAELHMHIGADPQGNWSGMEEDFTMPFERIRVEVRVGDGVFVPLIDGPIVARRFELSGSPNQSRMVLTVQDDSVLLNLKEEVAVFEEQGAHEIAQDLFQSHDLDAEVESVEASGSDLERVILQRGTAMQLLRELARRHGMFVYVKPGDSPGKSVGVFARPALESSDLPEILLMGESRNVDKFEAQFDALRPLTARAQQVRVSDKQVVESETVQSSLTALGDEAAHDLIEPGRVLLARTREESNDLDAATLAAVDESSWAYSASGEVSAEFYPAVLLTHQVVRVVGAGGFLSGDYLISQVGHELDDNSYRQKFTLRRNAGSAGSDSGGLLGGIF